MKKIHKVFVAIFVLAMVIPSVAFASWWNPFSWGIFSKHSSQIETMGTTTPINKPTVSTSTATTSQTTASSNFTNFDGTLSVSAPMRECPSSQCKLIRYYAETATVRVVGKDNAGNWYRIQAKDDGGNLIQGWMTTSAFVKSTTQTKPQTKYYPTVTQFHVVSTSTEKLPSVQTVVSPNVTSWTDLETKYFAEDKQKGWTSITITNEAGAKHFYRLENGVYVIKNTLAETQQPYQIAPSTNTTLCNGTNYNQCPTGQSFVCPGDGGTAYCQLPKQNPPVFFPTYNTTNYTDQSSQNAAILLQQQQQKQQLQQVQNSLDQIKFQQEAQRQQQQFQQQLLQMRPNCNQVSFYDRLSLSGG